MEAIQQFIDKKKKRIYFGIRMFVVMVLAAALLILLVARGDIQKILDGMQGAIVTTGAALVSFLISLIVVKMKMVLRLDAFDAEEKARIAREAGKMPQVSDFMITSDVLIFVQGFRVHAIPVRDVVWAYSQTQSSTHVYRGGGLFVPIRRVSQYLVVVLRDKKRVRIPLEAEDSNQRAEVLYAYEVMKRKRPKVWMGYEEKLDEFAKKDFEALVSYVDREGTTDGRELEVQYGLNHWYQQELPGYDTTQNENIYGVLRGDIEGVLFPVMMFSAVLAALLYYLPPTMGGDDITRMFQTDRWHFFAPAVVLAAIPIMIFIVYIKTVVRDSHRKKYGRLHASYLIMMTAWFLFLTAFLLLGGRAYGISMFSEKSGLEEIAKEAVKLERNGEMWTYGEFTYPRNPGIYGYDRLTEDEQCVFDFLQSRTMSKPLEQRLYDRTKDGTLQTDSSGLTEVFELPVPISRESCKKINQLFEANQKFDSYDPIRYEIQTLEGGSVTKMYVGVTIYGEPEEANSYHLEYEQMVQKTAQAIQEQLPEGAGDRQKIEQIEKYFKKKFKPFDDKKWFDKISGNGGEEEELANKKMRFAKSGYGLLQSGSGKEQAYMEAFGAVARTLGMSVIPVMNDDELQHWNKVCIDGKWYNIDLYQMAAKPDEAEKYNLVSDRQMERNGMKQGFYGRDETLSLP